MILVIGAGVIGLACGVALAKRGKEVLVVEKNAKFGQEVSARNSQVIHGGMYYGDNTLRAEHCLQGRRMMVERCIVRGLPHKMTGKLIVATNEAEDAKIAAIYQQGLRNGVEGLKPMTAQQAKALEPALFCTSAILSEATGIVDTHSFMLSLVGELEDLGGMIAYNSCATKIYDHFKCEINGDIYEFDAIINAASLEAHSIAQNIEGLDKKYIPPRNIAKGTYFKYAKRSAFSRLIYPAPVEAGGLGIHVTLDLGGEMRFGPDLEWVFDENYDVDVKRADNFYAAIRTYFPSIEDNALVPDYTGIRPKINGKGEPLADFLIQGEETHGVRGLVNLFGIESPGLTSSLSIAEKVSSLIH